MFENVLFSEATIIQQLNVEDAMGVACTRPART